MDADLLAVLQSICGLLGLEYGQGLIWQKNGSIHKMPSGGVSYGYTLKVAGKERSFTSVAYEHKLAAAGVLFSLEQKAFWSDCYEHTIERINS